MCEFKCEIDSSSTRDGRQFQSRVRALVDHTRTTTIVDHDVAERLAAVFEDACAARSFSRTISKLWLTEIIGQAPDIRSLSAEHLLDADVAFQSSCVYLFSCSLVLKNVL